jgi:protein-arginine kinase activator protein McsA
MTRITCRKCGDTGSFVATSEGLHCDKCGIKHIAQAKAPSPYLLDNLVYLVSPLLSKARPVLSIDKCKTCGITWEDIARTGRLGCHNDYEIFGDKLSEWLLEIHGSNKHKA